MSIVVAMVDDSGSERVVTFASRSLTPCEQNYSTTELECLSIIFALNKFRSFVLGQHITIKTDHRALTFLKQAKFLNQRLIRWTLGLQEYDYEIMCIPGSRNVLADYLSRVYQPNLTKPIAQFLVGAIELPALSRDLRNKLENIRNLQRRDLKLGYIINNYNREGRWNFFN